MIWTPLPVYEVPFQAFSAKKLSFISYPVSISAGHSAEMHCRFIGWHFSRCHAYLLCCYFYTLSVVLWERRRPPEPRYHIIAVLPRGLGRQYIVKSPNPGLTAAAHAASATSASDRVRSAILFGQGAAASTADTPTRSQNFGSGTGLDSAYSGGGSGKFRWEYSAAIMTVLNHGATATRRLHGKPVVWPDGLARSRQQETNPGRAHGPEIGSLFCRECTARAVLEAQAFWAAS